MSEIKYVEITINVPKKIFDFLKIVNEDVKEYVEYSLKQCCRAHFEASVFNEALEKICEC